MDQQNYLQLTTRRVIGIVPLSAVEVETGQHIISITNKSVMQVSSNKYIKTESLIP